MELCFKHFYKLDGDIREVLIYGCSKSSVERYELVLVAGYCKKHFRNALSYRFCENMRARESLYAFFSSLINLVFRLTFSNFTAELFELRLSNFVSLTNLLFICKSFDCCLSRVEESLVVGQITVKL